MKNILVITILVCAINGAAQKNNNSDLIYDAYINSKIDIWKKVCDEMFQHEKKTNDYILTLLNYEYGYIAHCIAKSNKVEALKYLVAAEKNLLEIESSKYKPSFVMSYKSAFYSFRAGLDTKAALKSAVKSLECANKALTLDSTNYFAYLQRGNIYRHTPASFKGSKQQAIIYYLKAETLIKKENVKRNWNYINLLVTITETYLEVKDFKTAKKYYDKIRKLEPTFYPLNDKLVSKLK